MLMRNRKQRIYENHINTRERFDNEKVAQSYLLKKNNLSSFKNRREISCIEKCLSGLKAGSKVLDLPCGTGRLETMLLKRGYFVTAADYSNAMLKMTIAHALEELKNKKVYASRLKIGKQDVLNTTFQDNTFDAVICNRLLHHYPEAELRCLALKELARISKERVIVSFFSNFSVSAMKFHFGNKLLGIDPTDRIPIWLSQFKQEIEDSGLRISVICPVNFGVSPQTYLLLNK